MIKNILVLSSDYTGHGHKSIADSLVEQFSMHQDVKVHVIDGFSLGGNMGLRIGKAYGTVTRSSKELWKVVWDITVKMPLLVREFVEHSIRDSLLELLGEIKPDVIVAIHPNFVGAVINILEEHKIRIPLVAIVADLISITPLWADPRTDCTICPTEEAKEKCMEFGVPESKIEVLGFPVRSKFCGQIADCDLKDVSYRGGRPIECLIMSGGEGSGNMRRLAKILLKNFDSKVKIVTGRNTVLKKRLELTLLEKYPGRVEVFGFTENIQDLMLTSDIAFTRGSPNVMMEAVQCNVPLVITGALPGQEEQNPEFMEKYNLGVVCDDLNKLKNTVIDLLADNADKLNRIKEAQRKFRKPEAAKNIAEFILSMEKPGEANISGPEKKPKIVFKANGIVLNKLKRRISIR